MSGLEFSIRHLKELGATSVRYSQNWKIQEPAEGVYDWSGLDASVKAFNQHGIRILLTVEAIGPSWRCGATNGRSCVFNDLEAFKGYVSTLAKRYRGKIERIQFGNEAFSDYWYVGTTDEFVAAANVFHDAVKENAPEMKVVLAGAQTSVPHVLSVCRYGKDIPSRDTSTHVLLTKEEADSVCRGPAPQALMERAAALFSRVKYDIADLHLYDNPEYWRAYRETMSNLAPGVPFLASEIGAPNKRYEPLDDTFHASRVDTILSVLPSLNLVDAYYFKLIEYDEKEDMDHEKSGLIGYPELDLKAAYTLVRRFNWGR